MDCYAIDSLSICQLEQREEMLVDSVDAARSDQSHQMQRAAVAFYLSACTHQRRVGVEASIGNGRGDPYQILQHYSTRAEIEVSHLTVAHLSFGQSDAQTGRFEQRSRSAGPNGVPGRRV